MKYPYSFLEESCLEKKHSKDMIGQVLWGSNNIYYVICEDDLERICRLHGKILQQEGISLDYQPISCGDFVLLDHKSLTSKSAQIYRRVKRKNSFNRRNIKKGQIQTFAANIDGVIILASWEDPKLRPAFLDRLLIAAQQSSSNIIVLINKVDTVRTWRSFYQLCRTLQRYRKLGITIEAISIKELTKTKQRKSKVEHSTSKHQVSKIKSLFQKRNKSIYSNCLKITLFIVFIYRAKYQIKNLYSQLSKKTYLIIGASGVGKSSFCNYLFPSQNQKIQSISKKWNRGVHTTTLAQVLSHTESVFDHKSKRIHVSVYRLIDTPGIRNFLPYFSPEQVLQLSNFYPEFRKISPLCGKKTCQHREEPECAVRDAAETNQIYFERYSSYLNLYVDLEENFLEQPQYRKIVQNSTRYKGKKRRK